VVDNASADGSAQIVRERFPRVRLIENVENAGFARANNQAIEVSRGEQILLLNSDTMVLPGALETLTQFMMTHPKAGAAGARLLNPDGSLQASCAPFPTLSREAWRLFYGDRLKPRAGYPMEEWNMASPRPVDVLLGACLLVRRTALDQVGLLDANYFMYSEEVDLCLRIKEAGWSIYWVPEARVVHYGGQSSNQMAERMFLQLYRSKVLYFRKHAGRLPTAAYKGLLATAALTRIVWAFLTRSRAPDRSQTLASNYRRLLSEVWAY
jgi:GT2 family glycosyltransferase